MDIFDVKDSGGTARARSFQASPRGPPNLAALTNAYVGDSIRLERPL